MKKKCLVRTQLSGKVLQPELTQHGFFLDPCRYGAVILSFLGGVRWGMAVDGSKFPPSSAWYHYTWSVTPSLMAWAALCLPSISGMVTKEQFNC